MKKLKYCNYDILKRSKKEETCFFSLVGALRIKYYNHIIQNNFASPGVIRIAPPRRFLMPRPE